VLDLEEDTCRRAIQDLLLSAYSCVDPDTGLPPFAFRLHQFISRGDTVYASLEPEAERHTTLEGQRFVPGHRDRILLPLVFCRECGQEYYCATKVIDSDGSARFEPRELNDQGGDDHDEAGFLYLSTDEIWRDDLPYLQEHLPEDWFEDTASGVRVQYGRRKLLPKRVIVSPSGQESDSGRECRWIAAPFRFCLHCGVAYGGQQRSDFGKLAELSSEGRSTATTILVLSSIRHLRDLAAEEARKLLSFTDNRQDASLQAGHFNDFIEVALLRHALYVAAKQAGDEGLAHEVLTQRAFDALALPRDRYAADPDVRFAAAHETDRAFRDVLGYRIYRDLERGWRITAPNLEQCGLLEIRYLSLDELCRSDPDWQGLHPALATASAETRCAIARVLLDFIRRELAIKVDYLDQHFHERLQQQSSQWLQAPWALDPNEKPRYASIVFPRSRRPGDYGGHVFLSARGAFGQYLRRSSTFPDCDHKLTLQDTDQLCRELLEVLRMAGLVEYAAPLKRGDEAPGYQLRAASMRWVAGDGQRGFADPLRTPALP
jgi:ATP-dependent helicase YprA (DUF1998 family)